MISRTLILVYIVCVLLFAGFARAAQLPERESMTLKITDVQYQSNNWLLHINGYMSHPCTTNPYPVISHSQKDAKTLVIQVVAQEKQGMCIQKISDEYDLSFDLRTLFSKSDHLNLDKDQTYTLVAGGFEGFELEVNPKRMNSGFPFSTIELQGHLVILDDGSVALDISQHHTMSAPTAQYVDFSGEKPNNLIEVVSSDLMFSELDKYLKGRVAVSGHLFVDGYPASELHEADLKFGAPQMPYSQLLVTGIHLISL